MALTFRRYDRRPETESAESAYREIAETERKRSTVATNLSDSYMGLVREARTLLADSYSKATSQNRGQTFQEHTENAWIMATALNKSMAEVGANYDRYLAMFTGSRASDHKGLGRAFADSWKSYTSQKSLAKLQRRLDRLDDDDPEALEVRRRIQREEENLAFLGDQADRGWLSRQIVQAAPGSEAGG